VHLNSRDHLLSNPLASPFDQCTPLTHPGHEYYQKGIQNFLDDQLEAYGIPPSPETNHLYHGNECEAKNGQHPMIQIENLFKSMNNPAKKRAKTGGNFTMRRRKY